MFTDRTNGHPAFLLAVSTTAYQLWSFLRGADVHVYHPDNIYIYFDNYSDNVRRARVAGQLSFTNDGDVGRNGIVRSVTVFLKIGPYEARQEWASFASTARLKSECVIPTTQSLIKSLQINDWAVATCFSKPRS